MIALGIDAGGSSTRWLLRDGDRELSRGRVATASGPPYDEASRRETHRRFEQIAFEALRFGQPEAVVAGVTGIDEGSATAEGISAVLTRALGLDSDRARIVNDMQIAYRSVFEPLGGVLVYAGTGSIACCELADGRLLRVGGHGYLIDDAGGGFWIGREALRSVLRAWDVAGKPEGILAGEVCGLLGAKEWPQLRAAIYAGGRAAVASLVPAVSAAARAGDVQALEILAGAGRELARLANVLRDRVGMELPVALAGGVSELGSALTDALRATLPAGTRFEVAAVEPVEAAAAMAVELARSAPLVPSDAERPGS